MVEIEINEKMLEEYNKGNMICLHMSETEAISLTKDKAKTFSTRELDGKKIGCYLLSGKDKTQLNEGETILFYNGINKIFLKKIVQGDLQ